MSEENRHTIRIPGLILDELKNQESPDARFNQRDSKKRKYDGPRLGRKEKRKQERLAKKQKRTGKQSDFSSVTKQKYQDSLAKPQGVFSGSKNKNFRAQSAKAENSNGRAPKKSRDLPFSSDDDLDSDDFDDIDDELDSDEREQLRELEQEGSGSEDETGTSDNSENETDDDELDGTPEMTAAETMQALAALKENKRLASGLQRKDTALTADGIHSSSDHSDGSDYIDEEQDEINESDFDEVHESIDTENSLSVEETMAALKALKNKKNGDKTVRFATGTKAEANEEADSDTEIPADSYDLSADDFESEDESLGEDSEMTAEETMAALKAMKEKKKPLNNQDSTSKVKKIKHRSKKHGESDEEALEPILTPQEKALMERDEMDMQYYAKKLGLKGKTKKIKAKDEYDAIGGLLDGLDFFEDYGASDEDYGDLEMDKVNKADSSSEEESSESYSESESSDEDHDGDQEEDDTQATQFSSDDEIDSDDFDEFDENDLNEEEWKQLRELEGVASDESDVSEHEDSSSKKKKKKSKQKENPYVAPVSSVEEAASGAYIPPSLRKQQALATEDAKSLEIKKKIKIGLNKLSESNLANIVSSLSDLYSSYPRQLVSDIYADQMIELVSMNNKVLDSFVMNYSAVTFSLWKLKGVEMGATFVQKVVEEFLRNYHSDLAKYEEANAQDDSNDEKAPLFLSKKASNIVTLLAYCYNFGMISCKLIYDIINLLVSSPNEYTTEILLRIISVSGPMIRGDDPLALKNSLTNLLNNVKLLKNQTSRMKFLLDTVADLKNNRLKTSLLAPNHSSIKKSIVSALKLSSHGDPIQVSLFDIENVNTKGKWWLVGASWRGNDDSAFGALDNENGLDDMEIVDMEIEDDILDDIPDWGKIAKEQRMNTELRRSLFVSVMSAQDFMDAFTKIEKLNLKNKQSLEIPRVVLHCATVDDNGFNPFYSVLSSKLSEYNHNVVKGLQFQFWNVIKRFENDRSGYGVDTDGFEDDENDEETQQQVYGTDDGTRLKRISAQALFFGYLIADGTLKFDIFKHVPLIGGLNSDGVFFIELVLYQILKIVAKKSEAKKGKNVFEYQDNLLRQIFLKGIRAENVSMILKSLNWFVTKKFKPLKLIQHSKGSKEFLKEERRLSWAHKTLKKLIKGELEHLD
ncbi:hypothetical protein ACO0RG_003720 [Hanseniaspora osmophila]|uniref:Suppressor of glycerol defect protein 1 n=1 Tax=Hanseniaspora osmophila TaxID=56408 RepID=A0A1E5RE34_9ASCO|nr:Suppressor of glycerol defect protein 1 [Hanseniaspora osmophila]